MQGVTSADEIKECQDRLVKVLTKSLNKKEEIRISSGRGKCRVQHNGSVWFYHSEYGKENKFWNSFGLDPNPEKSTVNREIAQINLSFSGIGICNGVFARAQEYFFLLHNGNLYGNSKTEFLNWYFQHDYTRRREITTSQGKVIEGVLVGNICDSQNFLDDLELFIKNVRLFKKLTKNSESPDTIISELRKEIASEVSGRPETREATISIHVRDMKIAVLAKLMSEGKCRLCGKEGPFPDRTLGQPFLETHHVKWLSRGGKDSIDNTVALCPNCHGKMHHMDNNGDVRKLRDIAKKQMNS